MSDASNKGDGKQAKYKGDMGFGTPMKDGPAFGPAPYCTPDYKQASDMKGPAITAGGDKYPNNTGDDISAMGSQKASLNFWKNQGKDVSSTGDLGSTSGVPFSGKMPAGINRKRDI